MFNIDWEPFNGMAHRPWLMFFGLILCIIAWVAVLFLCVFAGYNISSENETTLVETSFIAYETSKNELHLSAPTGETYIINFYNYYNGYFDNPAFLLVLSRMDCSPVEIITVDHSTCSLCVIESFNLALSFPLTIE